MKAKIFSAILLAAAVSSCSDFLERPPMDEVVNNPEFYNNENNVKSTVDGWYDIYFTGYMTSWDRSDFFEGTNVAEWCDDLAQQEATFFTTVAPSESDYWDFSTVRRINILIAGVEGSSLPEETKNHWLGVGRFFRGMEYSKLVRTFGDVPFYDKEVMSDDVAQLYKPRDSREYVMDKVLEDFTFAANNVRTSDGTDGLTVNRSVVDAYMSKVFLFEGTWQKYREKNNEYAEKYLKAAKDAAARVMDGTSGKTYSISDDYKALTTSLDLAGNPEILLYRSYVSGVKMHAEMSWQIEQVQASAPSKSLVESYLTTNGLPINQSGNADYKGDKTIKDELANRDPRLLANVADSLCLNGVVALYGIGGYLGNRFINESLIGTADGQSNTNVTDAPIMKYNEVLLNYIEAAAELADMGQYSLTQTDFDNTINAIRKRASVNMPALTFSGNQLSVNGVVINDPDRDLGNPNVPGDYEVSPILWEIRRERRVELVYEGLRFDDLRRWSKLWYSDMVLNPKVNMGAYVDKAAYVAEYNAAHGTEIKADQLAVVLDGGETGYIIPIQAQSLKRTFAEKDYLYPIPKGQISLYKSKADQVGDQSLKLEQNPGW